MIKLSKTLKSINCQEYSIKVLLNCLSFLFTFFHSNNLSPLTPISIMSIESFTLFVMQLDPRPNKQSNGKLYESTFPICLTLWWRGRHLRERVKSLPPDDRRSEQQPPLGALLATLVTGRPAVDPSNSRWQQR